MTCATNGVTLTPRKFKFAKKEIDFVGCTRGWDRYAPSDDTLSAIRGFPMASEPSISDIHAWFGLVNQLSPFFAASNIMEPFRELLKPSLSEGKHVFWDDTLQNIFEQSKEIICQIAWLILTLQKNIIVNTDWSTQGIAFTILQSYNLTFIHSFIHLF